jgi:MSHA biogenesis protein MshO
MTNPNQQTGFTLVEMIVVMVITGIIGGMVAIFIKAPVQGYVDSSRRAEMTDIADTALRRLSRDIRTAVPNSVRVANPAGTNTYIEFLPTRDGGRYRLNGPGNVLNFDTPDGSADIIGGSINFITDDQIVIGSTQSDGNPPYITTTAGILRAHDNGKTGLQTTVDFTSTALPASAEVQGQRFDIVPGDQQAVTYACLNPNTNASGDGTGTLTRYWHYGFHATQQSPAGIAANTAPVSAHSNAILADKVSDCAIIYDVVNQRNALVSIRLEIKRGGESISLYHTIHVNNVP